MGLSSITVPLQDILDTLEANKPLEMYNLKVQEDAIVLRFIESQKPNVASVLNLTLFLMDGVLEATSLDFRPYFGVLQTATLTNTKDSRNSLEFKVDAGEIDISFSIAVLHEKMLQVAPS